MDIVNNFHIELFDQLFIDYTEIFEQAISEADKRDQITNDNLICNRVVENSILGKFFRNEIEKEPNQLLKSEKSKSLLIYAYKIRKSYEDLLKDYTHDNETRYHELCNLLSGVSGLKLKGRKSIRQEAICYSLALLKKSYKDISTGTLHNIVISMQNVLILEKISSFLYDNGHSHNRKQDEYILDCRKPRVSTISYSLLDYCGAIGLIQIPLSLKKLCNDQLYDLYVQEERSGGDSTIIPVYTDNETAITIYLCGYALLNDLIASEQFTPVSIANSTTVKSIQDRINGNYVKGTHTIQAGSFTPPFFYIRYDKNLITRRNKKYNIDDYIVFNNDYEEMLSELVIRFNALKAIAMQQYNSANGIGTNITKEDVAIQFQKYIGDEVFNKAAIDFRNAEAKTKLSKLLNKAKKEDKKGLEKQ